MVRMSYGVAVQLPHRTPASHSRVPGPSSALCSSFLLMCPLGGSRRWFKWLSPSHPCRRSRQNSWLLTLTLLSLSCCRHFGNESTHGSSLSISACVSISLFAFQINKEKLVKEKMSQTFQTRTIPRTPGLCIIHRLCLLTVTSKLLSLESQGQSWGLLGDELRRGQKV